MSEKERLKSRVILFVTRGAGYSWSSDGSPRCPFVFFVGCWDWIGHVVDRRQLLVDFYRRLLQVIGYQSFVIRRRIRPKEV